MEHRVDVSQLEPCEPLQVILDRLEGLPPGDCLHVTHRMEPLPLYGLLKEMGLAWRTNFEDGPARVAILIWRPDAPPGPDEAA